MNRLVRIALTLFISACILLFLVVQRLERAKGMVITRAEEEIQMAYFGMGIAGLMIAAGVGLMITALIRSRKKPGDDE